MEALVEQATAANGRPERRLVALSSAPEPLWAPLVIRLATQADRRSLERLAQLDSARPPAGQTVIGELQGQAVAAVSLSDGKAISDPFVAAGEIVELVRLRAQQLAPKQRGRRLAEPLRAR
jgi:hypothetical protein